MKRAFAMVLAVTLFFSFAVVGYADEQVTVPLSGQLLAGSVSFLDTLTVQADMGNSYPMIGSAGRFVAEAGARNRFAIYPSGSSSGSYLLLAPIYQYKLSLDIQVPFAPTRLLIQYYGSDGSTILGDWVELTSDNYSYADGRFVFDSLVSVSQVCRLRNVTVWFDDQTLTEPFAGKVGEFTFTNVDVSADVEGGFLSVYTPNSLKVYYSLSSGSDDATGSVGELFQIPIVNMANQYKGNSLEVVVKYPSGSTDYLEGMFSASERFYFVLEAFTNVGTDLFYNDLTGYDPDGGMFDVQQLSSNRVRVSGYVQKSVNTPLSFFFNAATENTGNLFFTVEEFVCIPLVALSDYPSYVTGDNGSAGFFKDLFGDLYNSFVGFFISREQADEDTYNEANNEELPGKIEEAYTASEQVDSFEQQMWTDLDTYSSDINPDSFSFGPEFISSMGWIAATWTDCFNGLGSWQSIITFPMFLGLAMLIIGRGSQAIDRGVAKHERAQRREAQSRTAYKRHEELMDKLG